MSRTARLRFHSDAPDRPVSAERIVHASHRLHGPRFGIGLRPPIARTSRAPVRRRGRFVVTTWLPSVAEGLAAVAVATLPPGLILVGLVAGLASTKSVDGGERRGVLPSPPAAGSADRASGEVFDPTWEDGPVFIGDLVGLGLSPRIVEEVPASR